MCNKIGVKSESYNRLGPQYKFRLSGIVRKKLLKVLATFSETFTFYSFYERRGQVSR
jgi:hypothetical protein